MAVSDVIYGFYLGCTCLVSTINGDAFVFTDLGLPWRENVYSLSLGFVYIDIIHRGFVSFISSGSRRRTQGNRESFTSNGKGSREGSKKFLIPSVSWIIAGVISFRRNLYLKMDNWEILSAFFIFFCQHGHMPSMCMCARNHIIYMCFALVCICCSA